MKPFDFLDEELEALSARRLNRENISLESATGPRVVKNGHPLLNFSSNDYLSLAADKRLAQAATEAAKLYGTGAGASRLLGGDLPVHRELEEEIADLKGTPAALLFSSGSAANTGTIPALVGQGDMVLSDALNHASLIDGARLSRAERRVYRHLDLDDLEKQLMAHPARRKLIVTESLFSMDGDVAPLADLCNLADRHGAMLYVDEAHATGIYGDGAGLCREFGVEGRVHVQMGTLSKALGAAGGYIAGERRLIHFLINRARTYVFSTAPSPPTCEAAIEAIRIVKSEEGAQRRAALLARAAELRDQLAERGLAIYGGEFQVMAVKVPDPSQALAASEELEARGYLIRAVRPPTVPEGTSRLRLCVSAGHTQGDVTRLAQVLATVLHGT